MEAYRCYKALLLERYDEKGERMPGKVLTVKPGTVMFRRGELRIAAPTGIRLEGEGGLWVEMTPVTLVEHFEPVRDLE